MDRSGNVMKSSLRLLCKRSKAARASACFRLNASSSKPPFSGFVVPATLDFARGLAVATLPSTLVSAVFVVGCKLLVGAASLVGSCVLVRGDSAKSLVRTPENVLGSTKLLTVILLGEVYLLGPFDSFSSGLLVGTIPFLVVGTVVLLFDTIGVT